MKTIVKILAAGLVAGSALSAVTVMAQDYPNQPVTIVVPFSAGGPTDTVTRLVAAAMSEDLGQQVVVQNVGGAGGTLGAGQVAAAANARRLVISHINPQIEDDTVFDLTAARRVFPATALGVDGMELTF